MHPLQKNCSADDPKEFAAWAWAAGIPDPSPVRPEPIPLIGPPLVGGLSEMLWNFGFRHHPEHQRVWIEGAAGLGGIAKLVDKQPIEDPLVGMAKEFLGDNNPKLLEIIMKAPPEERAKIVSNLEKDFAQLIEELKRKTQ